MYTISPNGVQLIIQFESFRATAYLDQAGIWTIGYGSIEIDGIPVKPGDTIDEPRARAAFLKKLRYFEKQLTGVLPLTIGLTQNQVDALLSFMYNVGDGGFRRSSLLRAILQRRPVTEDLFTRWNKVTVKGVVKVSNGLTARRKREFALFIS